MARSRSIAGVVIVALLITALAWWWSAPTHRDDAARAANTAAAAASSATNEREVDAAPLGEERSTIPRSEVESVSTERGPEVAPPPTETAPQRTVEFTTVEQKSGAVVAGVEVTLISTEAPDLGALMRANDIDAMWRDARERRISDEAGHVQVPVSERTTILLARKDELAGYALLQSTQDSGGTLPLVRDGELEVEVVDALGHPLAGLEATIRRNIARYANDYGAEKTDANGRARLRHARMIAEIRRGDAKYTAAVRGLFEPQVAVALDASVLDSGRVRLVVPPFGVCDVELRDDRGEPEQLPFTAILLPTLSERDRRSALVRLAPCAIELRDVRGGVAHFPVVQVGIALTAEVTPSSSALPLYGDGVGPTAENMTSTIRVSTISKSCVLRGRLLHAQAGVDFVARVDVGTGPFGVTDEARLALEPNGAFRVIVAPQNKPNDRRLVVFTRASRGGERTCAIAPLPAVLTPGTIDVGEWELAPAPLLVSGRVVDAFGEALAEVELMPECIEPESKRLASVRAVATRSDATGAFEIRTSREFPAFRLIANQANEFCAIDDLQPGATNVLVAFAKFGSIAGHVERDADLRDAKFALRANSSERAEETSNRSAVAILDANDDGSFELGPLLPGTYVVRVTNGAGDICYARIEDVVVTPEPLRDARLDPLDLRGVLRRVQVEIVTPREIGRARPWFVARAKWTDGREQVWSESAAPASVPLIIGPDGVDLRIGAPRCAERELLGVRDDVRVELSTAPTIVLRLPPGIESSPSAKRIGVRLVRDSFGAEERTEFHIEWFDDVREIDVEAPAVGIVRVEPWLWFDKTNRNITPIRIDPPQTVEVLEFGPRQVVELRVGPDDIESAYHSLFEVKKVSR